MKFRKKKPAADQLDDIRTIIEGLPAGYNLYEAVGALVSIVEVLDRQS